MDCFRPGQLLPNQVVTPVARDCYIVIVRAPGGDLHHRGHAVRVAWVEPERPLAQLRHGRQEALASEVQVVREPALAYKKADELLGGADVAAVLEDHCAPERASDR